jgi:hypothetical protein
VVREVVTSVGLDVAIIDRRAIRRRARRHRRNRNLELILF